MGESILFVNKPKGMSSFDVIRILRKKLGVKKMGHAGTLDPLASGLLIIGIDEGTKKLDQYLKQSKTYEVLVLVGERRTTGDMEGDVVEKKAVSHVDMEVVKGVLRGMVGTLELSVPVYSAVKVGGKQLYKEARKGKKVIPPKRKMELLTLTLNNCIKENDHYILDITMDVGSGTYVRSIAEEIGRRLGYPATVKELRRTKIGEISIEEAQQLDDIH